MQRTLFLLILFSVSISACAQIALKGGMTTPDVQRVSAAPLRWSSILAIGFNPLVMLGLVLYFASAVVWLFVLSKVQVSLAYPFVALGFIITAILGRVVFHDTFSSGKIVGTVLIVSGVVALARG